MAESTAVMTVEEQLKQRLALQTQTLQKMAGGHTNISFKGGNIIVDDQVIPGGELDVIILGVVNERTFYDGPYDPNSPQTPACYSFNLQLPHPEAEQPQHENCRGCPQDEWGTGAQGRGKACREAARIALTSATADLEQATIYTAKVPISSIGTVRELVGKAGAAGKLLGQFVVKLIVKPDAKTFFKVTLMPIGENKADMNLILQRMDEAENLLNKPYPVFTEEAAPEVPKDKSGKAKY